MSLGHLKVKIFDAKGTQMVPVAKSTLTVGSAAHCDIVLDHASVMPEHVRAWLDGGRIWVQDLGGANGTSINGIRLPALKPMLVRELDVLKLGDCPATLGLEANLVRAPVVKSQVPSDGVTATDRRPAPSKSEGADKSREEVESLRREVADLKLQLQMAKAGGGAVDGNEAHRQNLLTKEELRKVNDQRHKLAETVARLEQEKQSYRRGLEQEIADLKLKALRDLKELKENELRKFEIWKAETVIDLNRDFRQLTQTKAKSWAARPLSQDMIFEWEADLNQILRRIILNDHQGASEIRVKASSGVYEQTQPSIARNTGNLATDAIVKAQTKTIKTAIKPEPASDALIRYILMGLGSSCLVAFAYLGWPYLKRSMASRAVANAPVHRTEQASSMPTRYGLKQSKAYRRTYAENMLYNLNFEAAEMNADFRRKWIDDLTKAARSWKVDERAVATLVGKEMQFILDLRRMKEGVKSENAEREILLMMRQRESTFLKDVELVLKNKQNIDKFLKYKRSFFTRNSPYLVRQPHGADTPRH